MSFFIKFDSEVPPVSNNFGVKIHGHVFNDWVKTCKKGQWHWVSVIGEQTMDDLGHLLIIFDTVEQAVNAKISMVQLQGFNGQPLPKVPPKH